LGGIGQTERIREMDVAAQEDAVKGLKLTRLEMSQRTFEAAKVVKSLRDGTTKLTILIATAFAASLSVTGANAFILTEDPGVVVSSLKRNAHGCHYSCECGSLRGFGCEQAYHRHLHMLCLPVRCQGDDCDHVPSEGICRHIAPRDG
jgi:hypothetical protein